MNPVEPHARGAVVAVAQSRGHHFSKRIALSIRLIAGFGVDGDAHAGATVKHRSRVARDPSQPNLRQVHLIHQELFDELRPRGFNIAPGDFGENVTTSGIDAARSIMAESILTKIGTGRFHAYSAGSAPGVAPLPPVITKLASLGHDVSRLASKSWSRFTGPVAPRMDFVIALCDTLAGQSCPDFGALSVTGAWPLPDPAKFHGSPAEQATMLNEIYASLRRRIEIFMSLPFATLDRMALKARLDEIGVGMQVA